MVSSKRSTVADVSAEPRIKGKEQIWPAPPPSRAELALGFALALDLAEGRPLGHATRVCYIALQLAQALDLPEAQQRAAFYAALLHDAGAAPASAELCRLLGIGEEALFRSGPEKPAHQLALEISPADAPAIVEALRSHPAHGARVARDLGFETAVQEAILSHHERWDGHGYPSGCKQDEGPLLGRIVATADLMEAIIAGELNALTARRNLVPEIVRYAGTALDPELVAKARELARSDGFWLGLYDEDLRAELAAACPELTDDEERSPLHLQVFASTFAELADSKGEYTANHSERTADLAGQLAASLGFSAARAQALRIAALLHDVGHLGVPARVIAKPDILSLAEMEAMRKHPTYSQMVLEAIPALEEPAFWVGAHHERPDGRGYPEMLEGDTIPLEARIIAIADSYIALTSARPYRKALAHEDAIEVLLSGAGTQFDASLVRRFCQLDFEARSSRSAPRSRRTR